MATIELRAHRGIHLYYEFIDDSGQRIAQINGLSTDITTGDAIPIGGPLSSNDVIMIYSVKLDGTDDINANSGSRIFEGSESQVRNALAYISELSNFVNAQRLTSFILCRPIAPFA